MADPKKIEGIKGDALQDVLDKGDKMSKAEQKLKMHPYDLECWNVLIKDAQDKAIEQSRKVYERLVEMFPTCGRFWKLYIEEELKSKNFENVELLFQRCLLKVLNLDLWKFYLTYVRETKRSLPNFREKMMKAYEFALDKVGIDVASGSIWSDYVNFIKGGETAGSYAENQKIMAIRRVYQRAVMMPLSNVEQLWREYSTFEQGVNEIIAKKLLEERSRDYQNARRVTKDYEATTRGLLRGAPAVPPQNISEEKTQISMWKKYIAWEKSNPMRSEDLSMITKRVMYAFEQALLTWGHHPDIWYEAAVFLEKHSTLVQEKGDTQLAQTWREEVAQLYERATSGLLKNNLLLHFAYADYEENRMKSDKCHVIYNNLLTRTTEPTLVYCQYMKFARRAEGIKSARTIFKKAREDNRTKYHIYVSGALMEFYTTKDENIALKIFELGLKKFPKDTDYILKYLEHLCHQNDDNNSRVLFERVLAILGKDVAWPIWSQFLQFESNVGDLATLVKVEKRRCSIFEEECKVKETSLLVDRYKYLDLYPCTTQELRAMEYEMDSDTVAVARPVAAPAANPNQREPVRGVARPDFAHMVPYNPLPSSSMRANAMFGYPIPAAAAEILMNMPPPHCFQGPFVNVDALIKVITEKSANTFEEMIEKMSDDVSVEQYMQDNHPRPEKSRKRGHTEGDDEEEMETSSTAPPPVFDVYRLRQQRRLYAAS